MTSSPALESEPGEEIGFLSSGLRSAMGTLLIFDLRHMLVAGLTCLWRWFSDGPVGDDERFGYEEIQHFRHALIVSCGGPVANQEWFGNSTPSYRALRMLAVTGIMAHSDLGQQSRVTLRRGSATPFVGSVIQRSGFEMLVIIAAVQCAFAGNVSLAGACRSRLREHIASRAVYIGGDGCRSSASL